MIKLLWVGLGGFLGSVGRYAMSDWVHRLLREPWFPYGTLAVNVIGCFLIGLLSGLAEGRHLFSPETRLFLLTGMLGGFTTFSTFGYETFSFARDGQMGYSLGNVLLNVTIGFAAVGLGHYFARLG